MNNNSNNSAAATRETALLFDAFLTRATDSNDSSGDSEPWLVCPECRQSTYVRCIEGDATTCVKCRVILPPQHVNVTFTSDGCSGNGCGNSSGVAGGDARNRTYVDEMLPDGAMGTTVGSKYQSKAAMGKKGSTQKHLTRVSTWRRTVPSKERMLRVKFSNIGRTCHAQNISSACIKGAKRHYFSLLGKIEQSPTYTQRRGNNDVGLQAVSVYLSLTEQHVPCTVSDVATWFGIEQKYVTHALNIHGQLTSTLPLPSGSDVPGGTDDEDNAPEEQEKPSSNSGRNLHFLESYMQKLTLPPDIRKRVVEVYAWVTENKILERCTPQTAIAGCIDYVANTEHGLGIPIEKVGLSCGLTPQTINDASAVVSRRSYELY
jgi:transcription initiation factor TFIIIB Brf1 subunit/transcription initiation factor TFIIB